MRVNDKAIGVFDSGVGGLTVLRALMASLPNERTVYLGDTARVPYGTRSAEVVTRYSVQNARFLVDQDIKLLVVACNTASAVALPALSEALDVPVVGVIDPGAESALEQTKGGRIGVIGTAGTVRSGAYQRALASRRPGVDVVAKACPLFVPLAEEGWTHGEVPRLAAEQYLAAWKEEGVDTVVLGCTHYPLLHDVIADVLGPSIALVEPAAATARAVERVLADAGQLRDAADEPDHRYFITDIAQGFEAVAERFLGRSVGNAQQVDITFAAPSPAPSR